MKLPVFETRTARESWLVCLELVVLVVWLRGCLEVAAADAQAWQFPVAMGAAGLAIAGAVGWFGSTKEEPWHARLLRGLGVYFSKSARHTWAATALALVLSAIAWYGLNGSLVTLYCNKPQLMHWTFIGQQRDRACSTSFERIWSPFHRPTVTVIEANGDGIRTQGYCSQAATEGNALNCVRLVTTSANASGRSLPDKRELRSRREQLGDGGDEVAPA